MILRFGFRGLAWMLDNRQNGCIVLAFPMVKAQMNEIVKEKAAYHNKK